MLFEGSLLSFPQQFGFNPFFSKRLTESIKMSYKSVFGLCNYISVIVFSVGIASLAKRFLNDKPPGLQTLLDACIINACNAYMIHVLIMNGLYGK